MSGKTEKNLYKGRSGNIKKTPIKKTSSTKAEEEALKERDDYFLDKIADLRYELFVSKNYYSRQASFLIFIYNLLLSVIIALSAVSISYSAVWMNIVLLAISVILIIYRPDNQHIKFKNLQRKSRLLCAEAEEIYVNMSEEKVLDLIKRKAKELDPLNLIALQALACNDAMNELLIEDENNFDLPPFYRLTAHFFNYGSIDFNKYIKSKKRLKTPKKNKI